MKASQLIKKLAEQINKQGDLEVIVYPKLTEFDVFNGNIDYTPHFFDEGEDHIFKNRIVIDEIYSK